jgi:CHAD domain-containing protein
MAEKWVKGLSPDMPVSAAARRVLEMRFAVVGEYLPKAIHAPYDDVENVHQLRVGTRRADAALRIFRDCLPGKAYRTARERLRTIRRAAGAARDWDVFLAALNERLAAAPAADAAGLDFLIAYSLGQRHAAQPALQGLEEEEWGAGVVDEVREEEEEKEKGEERPFAEMARPAMEKLFEKLQEAASGDLSDYEHLHEVRITGKRLRYAMEVFAPCFVPAFKQDVYPRVEELQEILGRANDSHVAAQRLVELRGHAKRCAATWERARAGVEGLLKFHQRRLPQERRKFLKWWDQWKAQGLTAALGGVEA